MNPIRDTVVYVPEINYEKRIVHLEKWKLRQEEVYLPETDYQKNSLILEKVQDLPVTRISGVCNRDKL